MLSEIVMWLVVEYERTGDNCDACCGVSLVANRGVFDSEARAKRWAEANIIVEDDSWHWWTVEKVDFNPGEALC